MDATSVRTYGGGIIAIAIINTIIITCINIINTIITCFITCISTW